MYALASPASTGNPPGSSRALLDTMADMLSQETLEEYRRMTPGQRLELALRMTEENLPYLVKGSPDVVERRFELLRRENDLRNHNMLHAIARAQRGS